MKNLKKKWKESNKDVEKTLIKQTISACDGAGCSPLHNAASRNQKEMADELIRAGADVNIQDNLGMTPLMEAVFWDKIDLVRLMLTANVNFELVDRNGN